MLLDTFRATDRIATIGGSPLSYSAGDYQSMDLVPSSPRSARARDLIPVGYDVPLSRVLQLVLEHSGLAQAEVARRMAVKAQTINQYVRGYRGNPSLPWLLRFLSVNGASLMVNLGRVPGSIKMPEPDRAGRLPMPPRDLPEDPTVESDLFEDQSTKASPETPRSNYVDSTVE